MQDRCLFAIKEAERLGATTAEAYASVNKESEVLIENNDLKQAKSHRYGAIGIRVLVNKSIGFSSVNGFSKDQIRQAVATAIGLARHTQPDKFNVIPEGKKVKRLEGIYDIKSQSFTTSDSIKFAAEMLERTSEYDNRISVDSGSFSASVMDHFLTNSNGVELEDKISTFSWTLMGMALEGMEVSNFDFQFGGCHKVNDIDITTTSSDFCLTLLDSLKPTKINSFKGEMLLSPQAGSEMILDVIAHSINSHAVQKGASNFTGKRGQKVASELLDVIDDGTNADGLGASSFDREGLPHRSLEIIENGILKSFIYDSYTAKKEKRNSTGNAGGSPKSPPVVSATNLIIKPGKHDLQTLISEISEGVLINRFSGNVNPINGDFSGVVKGGRYIKNGIIIHSVKELMVAGNVFDALENLTGLSSQRKLLGDSLIPYMRFGGLSFTSG